MTPPFRAGFSFSLAFSLFLMEAIGRRIEYGEAEEDAKAEG